MLFHFCKLFARFLLVRIKGWIFKIASSLAGCCVQVKKEHKSHLNNERLRTTMVVTSTWLSSSELFCWRFVVLFPLGKCIFKKFLRSKGSVFFKRTSSDSLRKHTKRMGYRKRYTTTFNKQRHKDRYKLSAASRRRRLRHHTSTIWAADNGGCYLHLTFQEWDFLLRIFN